VAWGIKDLRRMNISLLCKWWWKAENGVGIWQDIIKKKYLKKGTIALLTKNPKNSPVWNDMLKVRHVYLKGSAMIVGNGKSTVFWHDRWCGLVSLADKFLGLYEISEEQMCYVEYMKLKTGAFLSFNVNLEDYMTLFTGMVLTLRMIEQFGNGRNRACFLLNLHTVICVVMSMVLVLRKFGKLRYL
jgi:hypothetical protein